MNNIYQHTKEQPFHISAGALLFDQEGRIATLEHLPEKVPSQWEGSFREHTKTYSLMRESLEEGEEILTALHRGLREEFGATGEPIHFIGSLQSVIAEEVPFEKTTLYFSVKLISQDDTKRDGPDFESELNIVWWKPEALIVQMESQDDIVELDLNESQIVRNYLSLQP